MSLFVCSKCGCIDNTATSYYWALMRPCKNRIYDKSLKGYEGKPLCSECAAIEYSKGGEVVVVPGTWHGKFKEASCSRKLLKEPVEERISVLLKDRKKKVVSIFYIILIMVICKAVIL